MRNIFLLLQTACFLSLASVAHADLSNTVFFTLNTIYIDRDYNDNGVTYQDKITDTDLRLGKIFKHYYAGVIYSQSSNDSSSSSRTAYGLSTGFFSEKDIFITAHYFLTANNSRNSNTTDGKGSGFEIDLGGLFKFTSSFYMGLMMSYKTFNYSERTTNGITTSTSVDQREMLPMFTVGFALQ